MSQIYLVRHGQASLGKANYDQLSPLGEQQAFVLGEHFKQLNVEPELVITGTLQRHLQTSAQIQAGLQSAPHSTPQEAIAHWNEFDFETLIRSYLAGLGSNEPKPKTPSEFFSALRSALLAWSSNAINAELPETWGAFAERALSALQDLKAREEKTIVVVSSGGAISMVLKHIMQLKNEMMVDLNLQSRNTGVTELFTKHNRCYVSTINHVAHLSTAKNKAMITHA